MAERQEGEATAQDPAPARRAPCGTPADERARLAALASYGILDTAPEAAFDDIAQLAADLLDAPIAQVNFIDARRQWTKADVGAGGTVLPLEDALCARAYRAEGVLVVPDLTRDPRFADNPFVVGEPGIRFYAAAPLVTPDGLPIGTLCVIDLQPRPEGIDERRRRGLHLLAAQVMRELELRRVATRARADEARFRALATAPAESGVVPVLFRATPDGAVTEALGGADAAAARDALRGFGWLDAVHPDDRRSLVHQWQAAIAGGAPARLEFRAKVAGGDWRWLQAHAAPVRAADGAVAEWVGAVTDIDAQRRAEAALRESEDHYRHAVELDPRTTWTASPDGQLDHVNPRWSEWTGTSGLGSGYVDALHPDDREPTVACWARSVTTGAPYDIEHRVRMRDGGYRVMHSRAFPRRDDTGRTVKWYGTTEDVHDRREAERAAQQAAADFEALAENVSQLAWMAEPNGDIFWYNKRWYDYTGADFAQMQGWGWAAVHDPAVLPEVTARWTAAITAGEPFEMTFPLKGADGAFRPFLTRAEPIRDANGALVRWFGTNTDISAERAAEARLRESEGRLRAVLDSVSDGFYALDAEFRLLVCNRAAGEHLGVDPHGDLGRTIFAAVGRAGTAEERAFYAGMLERAAQAPLELPSAVHADRLVELRAARLPDGGWAVSFTDVTERRRAEDRLRDSEARLRAVLDAAPVGLVFADATGQVTGGNAQVERLLGHDVVNSSQVADYRDDYVAFHADGRQVESGEYPLARALAGEERPELVCRVRRGDSSFAWIRYVASAIRGAEGSLLGGVVASIDVDREKRLTEDLAREVEQAVAEREAALAQLHEARKLETIGQLTGGVAHDFNNLLTPIVGALDLLRRRHEEDARASRLINGALQSAERAKTLVQRLLAFARRQTLQPRPVDPAALVDGMRDLIDRSLGPSIAVEVAVAPGLPAALVDPNQLELALLNLAVNARDAMPDGGRLLIEVGEDDGAPASGEALPPGRFVRFHVSDNGEGMDGVTLARAIEPFFSTKGVGKGTGLGLSMVHGLAAQSGGAFRLSSVPGEGTSACLWLPVASRAADAPAVEAPPASRAPRCATVLLVEDEELVRTAAAESLRELGYAVEEAAGAGEALDRVAAGLRPDVVVTDHAMPGLTGADLAERLAGRLPGVPVLLMTGFADLPAERTRDLEVLFKPFRQAELAGRVAALLQESDAARTAQAPGAPA